MIKKLFFSISLLVLMMSANSQLIITEIMYNPPEDGTDSLEFVEIYNSSSNPIDLTTYDLFLGSVGSDFPNVFINAGEYMAFSNDSISFHIAYGFAAREISFSGISNTSRDVKVKDGAGLLIDSVKYDDGSPWPAQADGNGYSLELCDVNADNSIASNWKAAGSQFDTLVINSVQIYASPGTMNTVSCAAVVISEYGIDIVNTSDVNGIPDSNALYCWVVGGVVTSVDFDGTVGYSIYMQDVNGNAINVYASTDEPGGYQSTIGDSISVRGTIAHYKGLLEVITDSIINLGVSSVNILPTSTTVFDESNESMIVTIENVSFYDTSELASLGKAWVSNSVNDTFQLNLDNEITFAFIADFTKEYNITGLISQRDDNSPFDSNYMLLPRFDADFVEMLTTSIIENNSVGIIAYPNPVKRGEEINLTKNVTALIADISGRKVGFINNSNKISTNNLQKGAYLLIGEEFNFKFIVE